MVSEVLLGVIIGGIFGFLGSFFTSTVAQYINDRRLVKKIKKEMANILLSDIQLFSQKIQTSINAIEKTFKEYKNLKEPEKIFTINLPPLDNAFYRDLFKDFGKFGYQDIISIKEFYDNLINAKYNIDEGNNYIISQMEYIREFSKIIPDLLIKNKVLDAEIVTNIKKEYISKVIKASIHQFESALEYFKIAEEKSKNAIKTLEGIINQ